MMATKCVLFSGVKDVAFFLLLMIVTCSQPHSPNSAIRSGRNLRTTSGISSGLNERLPEVPLIFGSGSRTRFACRMDSCSRAWNPLTEKTEATTAYNHPQRARGYRASIDPGCGRFPGHGRH